MTAKSVLEHGETLPMTLDDFLQSVELKAYRIAVLAVGEHADALDILQDSMLKLATHYADRDAKQWKPLFYRILQNRITDFHRQAKVKRMMFFWKADDKENQEQELAEPTPRMDAQPETALQQSAQQQDVLNALQGLPEKQRQCFLLRSWEGMSVADTAAAMGCSQGSVKTHYFRAVNKLRDLLGEVHDITI